MDIKKSFKPQGDHNPIMTQRFGADPFAMVYKDRVYIYMTCDKLTYDKDGKLTDNTYQEIDTISVASSADLVNWTDHGEVYAAGKNGIATWGGNSWAPAACWKNINGKDKFFLYFANSGNGIAVLTSDSPTGPFIDPIGGPLVSRNTPNCDSVTWLFDPAVLVDDDGTGWLYIGGGIPSDDKASNPGTARVVRLGDDMISLAEDPRPIENVAYLFEDSGINKINGKYYYSYCSNFNVTPEAEKEHGFSSGEIVTMVSDKPDGPFKPASPVLKNPEVFFGRGGNNHHCMFEFKGKWYIAYHSRILEEYMDLTGGYRSTNVDLIAQSADGAPTHSTGTRKGVEQVKCFDPYKLTSASTFASMAGVKTVAYDPEKPLTDPKLSAGNMIVRSEESGNWVMVSGADFGSEGASAFTLSARGKGFGEVSVVLDDVNGEAAAVFGTSELTDDFEEFTVDIASKITGVHDIYLVFSGECLELENWKFEK